MASRKRASRFRGTDSALRFPDQVEAAVARFGATVSPLLRAKVGQSEANITAAVESLLADVARMLGLRLLAHREVAHSSLGVRPDLAIDVGGARIGVVELKAPGFGVPGSPRWGKARDKAQWEKLKALPNVLYTDGAEWAMFNYGKQIGPTARMEGDLRRAGSRLKPHDEGLARLLHDFLWWEPSPPRDLRDLIKISAGLCHLLRDEVDTALGLERRGISKALFSEHLTDWQEWLFPDLTDGEFVDAYAQTITFGLLLARREGVLFEGLEIPDIGERLAKKHLLVGRALSILTARPDRGRSIEERSIVLQTMRRVIGVADWSAWSASGTYHWLYEAFLETYDPKIRRQMGAYYTPTSVTDFMTRFVDDILQSHLGIRQGLTNPAVVVLDPAMGTGTFLQSVIDRVAATVKTSGGDIPATLRSLLPRLIGFERQIGPFAVAELKLNQALEAHSAEAKDEDFRLYVADTLDDPTKIPLPVHARLYAPLADSRRSANRVKTDEPLMVVFGNPPYRTQAQKFGKWIIAKNHGQESLLDDFKHPGNGKYEHKLHDLAIYFWRWALWKAFESTPAQPAGIVAFITTHAYLDGPGFAGMRRYLREQADFGWIIDLSTEGHWSSVQTRIFPGVPHPVCIGIFARGSKPNLAKSAKIKYLEVTGDQTAKFDALALTKVNSSGWVDCSEEATAPLRPAQSRSWTRHPSIDELMPFTSLGVKTNRAWVRAPSRNILMERWRTLVIADSLREKKLLMKETRDRTVDRMPTEENSGANMRNEVSLSARIEQYGFRSFDRQYLIADERVVDYLRSTLWRIHGPRQVYLITQLRESLTSGPGIVFSAAVPDNDYFKGHHGGRVLPLYRDAQGLVANIAPGFCAFLSRRLSIEVEADDVFAYFAAAVGHSGYTTRFATELRQPGVRVPITSNPRLWHEGVTIGRDIIFWHTYGERFGNSDTIDQDLRTSPRVIDPIPGRPEDMPDFMKYDEENQCIIIGTGRIGPVSRGAFEYQVSGMLVLRHWFDYRKRTPAGRRGGSELDDLVSDRWTLAMTEELRNLIRVLEGCVALENRQAELLQRIIASPVITHTDLTESGILPASVDVSGPFVGDQKGVLF